ncbi:MAG: hypothetical protein GY856_02210 [bacterium]|nr:hypothetical protein [bacterium]
MEELLEFVALAPGAVIANHPEAFNHCPTTRVDLREAVTRAGMAQKVRIPKDGEVLEV